MTGFHSDSHLVKTKWVGGAFPVKADVIAAIARRHDLVKPVKAVKAKQKREKAAKEAAKRVRPYSSIDSALILRLIGERPWATLTQLLGAYHKAGAKFAHRSTFRSTVKKLRDKGLLDEKICIPDGAPSYQTQPCSMWTLKGEKK